jgi:Flp pilus assembly protein TadB
MSTALLLLALAIPLWSADGVARQRLATLSGRPAQRNRPRPAKVFPPLFAGAMGVLSGTLSGWPVGIPVGCTVAAAAWWGVRRVLRAPGTPADQLGLAASWDLLAACLRAGLPVPTAMAAIADDLPGRPRAALRATADLLALGADPVEAWAPAMDRAETAALARGARRTARSGTALAGVAANLATTIRDAAGDVAEVKAQRAGVLITGPLGLCFLPAFVCLGIVPVLAGLATQLSIHQ